MRTLRRCPSSELRLVNLRHAWPAILAIARLFDACLPGLFLCSPERGALAPGEWYELFFSIVCLCVRVCVCVL